MLIPLLHRVSKKGLDSGKDPQEIIKLFFSKHTSRETEEQKIDFMLRVIQYVERQIVLFDGIEDAAFADIQRDLSPINDEYNIDSFWPISSTEIRLHNGGSIGVYSFMYFDPKTKSGAMDFCNLPDCNFREIRNAVYKYKRNLFKKTKK